MLYRKIDVYLNNEYVCSTRQFRTLQDLKRRIRADKKIFVASLPNDRIIPVCDYDKLTLKYAD